MPPTNISFLTATDLGSTFPISSFTQNCRDGTTNYTVYFKITVLNNGVVGCKFAGSTQAGAAAFTMTVWKGPASSPTQLMPAPGSLIDAFNVPFQFSVDAGQDYFIRCVPLDQISTAILYFDGAQFKAESFNYPAGTIAISDDTISFPLALISAVDGSNIGYIRNFPTGEGGDSISDGKMLFEDLNGHGGLGSAKLYSRSFSLIAEVISQTPSGFPRNRPIRAASSGNGFYVAYKGGSLDPASVIFVDKTGAIGPTIWTLTGFELVNSIGASPDDTILYFLPAGFGQPVKRWDLVNNVALSDFLAGVGNRASSSRDGLLVLTDGTILIGWVQAGLRSIVRYAANGTVLNTYSFGTSFIDRITAAVDPNNFIVWFQDDLVTDEFREIRVSDGATVNSVFNQEFNTGSWSGDSNYNPASPPARPFLGHSNSCAIVILRTPGLAINVHDNINIRDMRVDRSGIYYIDPGKRNDTIYIDATVGSTEDVKIP